MSPATRQTPTHRLARRIAATAPAVAPRSTLTRLTLAGGAAAMLAACSFGGPDPQTRPADGAAPDDPPATQAGTADDPSSEGGAGGGTADCLVGSWTAPVARMVQDLGLDEGAFAGAEGTVLLTYTPTTWTITYDKVEFHAEGGGGATVAGTISGTYTLSGNVLSGEETLNESEVKVVVGGGVLAQDETVIGIVAGNLAPRDATVACRPAELEVTQRGGAHSTTLDRA